MIAIPVLVRIHGRHQERRIVARPLFDLAPEVAHARLEVAMDQLRSRLRKADLSALQAPGELEELAVQVRCDLRDRTEAGRVLVVAWPVGGVRCARLASWPAWTFVLPNGADAASTVGALLTQRLREEDAPAFADLTTSAEAWIDWLPLTETASSARRPRLADLFSDRPSDGRAELRRIGVEVDREPAEALSPCLGRETELLRLHELLSGGRRRAVALSGASGVGKTALLHGLVRGFRTPEGRAEHAAWVVPPAALIAGMSQIGAWEQRLDLILRHIEAKDLLLVIDDLPGWQRTGISSANSLDAARVLRSWIAHGRIRVLVEADDEVLAAARDRDRALVDLLEPLRLESLPAEATRRVLVGLARHHQDRGAAAVGVPQLAGILDAHRRHQPHRAMPGGPAALLAAVAAEGPGADPLTGLGVPAFSGLHHPELAWMGLCRRILDQPEAVEALGDALALAASAVADPERPVLSLLFSGPSGVGKTEAAKALAEAAFGDEGALLRIDCNELIAAGSAGRLTGDFLHPDGLLTGPVRRRPFSVILLDEIEKAHHEVQHLLLQVLGEGRLGDGEGRTVRFDRCIIILTANILPAGSMGFTAAAGELLDALPAHFPPELVNRIDRVVAFRPLGEAAIRTLADRACARLCARDGLVRRGLLIDVAAALVERIARGPFDPALGARELHRAVDRELAGPLAALAAGCGPGRHPAVVRIDDARPPAIRLMPLQPVSRPDPGEVADPLARRELLGRLRERCAQLAARRDELFERRREAGPVANAWAWTIGDELATIRSVLQSETERLDQQEPPAHASSGAALRRPPRKAVAREQRLRFTWGAYCAAENALDWLRSLATPPPSTVADLHALAGRLVLVEDALADDRPEEALASRVLVTVPPGELMRGTSQVIGETLGRLIVALAAHTAIESQLQVSDEIFDDGSTDSPGLLLAGIGARRLAQAMCGSWLVHRADGGVRCAELGLRELGPGPVDAAALAAASALAPAAPAYGPLRWILAPDGTVFDPGSGWTGRPSLPPEAWILAVLRQIGAS